MVSSDEQVPKTCFLNFLPVFVYKNLASGFSFRYTLRVERGEQPTMKSKNTTLKLVPAPAAIPADGSCGCKRYEYCEAHVREVAAEPCACVTMFDGFEAFDSGCPSCDAKAQLRGDDDIPY